MLAPVFALTIGLPLALVAAAMGLHLLVRRLSPLRFAILALALLVGVAAFAIHADLNRSIANILQSEGGYDNDPEDPGGCTNLGITIYDTRLYVKRDATCADAKALTRATVVPIYEKEYWDALAGDALPAGLDYTVVDYGVNSGVARAGRVLRQVLALSTADWHVTAEVLTALKGRAVTAVIRQVNDERSRFLHSLRTCPRFCSGWDKRVASVKAISLSMAGTPAPETSVVGWTAPVDNGLVKFTPLEPQPGPGKTSAEMAPPPPVVAAPSPVPAPAASNDGTIIVLILIAGAAVIIVLARARAAAAKP